MVPTRHRPQVLARTLASLLEQNILPAELIVVDASDDTSSRTVVEAFGDRAAGACAIRYLKAEILGAAAQRNQGVAAATQQILWFFDDDILFEPQCVARLWSAFQSSPEVGGASAMITNQCYHPPGRASRLVFTLMGGKQTFAGRVLGPAVNLLPEDREDLPEIVPVEWLNLGCTLYRREAMPRPPFSTHFTGYSMFEDLTLSLQVAKKWRLVNARTARIFHDTQPGTHKSDAAEMAAMELVNRHFVMTKILGRSGWTDYFKLFIWQSFGLLSCLRNASGWRTLPDQCRGRWRGWRRILAAPVPRV